MWHRLRYALRRTWTRGGYQADRVGGKGKVVPVPFFFLTEHHVSAGIAPCIF